MLISTKGRYALRVMIDLAEYQTDAYITLKGVAQRQGISEKYLESVTLADLMKRCTPPASAGGVFNRSGLDLYMHFGAVFIARC